MPNVAPGSGEPDEGAGAAAGFAGGARAGELGAAGCSVAAERVKSWVGRVPAGTAPRKELRAQLHPVYRSTRIMAISAASLTAPATFSGVSNFASSLQQVLTRAVGIASLPLQSDEVQLNSMQDPSFGSPGSGFGLFEPAAVHQFPPEHPQLEPVDVFSLRCATVSATVGSGATAGTYTISVGSLGSYSTAFE